MTMPRAELLENRTIWPFGLSKAEAAAYLGISAGLFDVMVKDGRMPPAKRINKRRIWLRPMLDSAAMALPDDPEAGERQADALDVESWETRV